MSNWRARFKMASAAARRAKEAAALEAQGHPPAPTVAAHTPDVPAPQKKGLPYTPAEVAQARNCDPRPYLESRGYTVKSEGRRQHIAILGGTRTYRLTQRNDGWVWCTPCGSRGGTIIDLVMDADGADFLSAMHALQGAPSATAYTPDVRRTPLTLPPSSHEVEGRAYLRGRGISAAALEKAESQGVLRYAEGAVFFVGYDREGAVRTVTRRGYVQGDPAQKRDLAGSEKRFAPLIRGGADVWIVEGGVSGLALIDYAPRVLGLDVPTILVSGGAGVTKWVNQEHIQTILKAAPRIVIAGEHEKDSDTQARTAALRQAQARAIFDAVRRMPEIWMPPEDCKDVAEANKPPGTQAPDYTPS